MKIQGHSTIKPYVEDIILPRGEEESIHLRAQAVMNFNGFDELCPRPSPPMVTRPNEDPRPDLKDQDFQKKLSQWAERRIQWLYMHSLMATEGLEWEILDPLDPETWGQMDEELSNFSAFERDHIYSMVAKVNALDEDHLTAARKRFLLERGRGKEDNSPTVSH